MDIMNNRRILIIDDEPDITTIFKIGLESSDRLFKVDTFTDPNLALSNYIETESSYVETLKTALPREH
jgi:DNA-binding response OmpR family regulator